MGISVIPLIVVAMVPIVAGSLGQRAIGKSSVTGNGLANADYPDYLVNNDEYPVVMPKRAALLFDQLMVALQKVVDNQGGGEVGSRGISRSSMPRLSATNPEIVPVTEDDQTMDLQRRGQVKGRVYWRCYFNAVTCFKRK